MKVDLVVCLMTKFLPEAICIHSSRIGNQEFRFGIQFDIPELVFSGEFFMHLVRLLVDIAFDR